DPDLPPSPHGSCQRQMPSTNGEVPTEVGTSFCLIANRGLHASKSAIEVPDGHSRLSAAPFVRGQFSQIFLVHGIQFKAGFHPSRKWPNAASGLIRSQMITGSRREYPTSRTRRRAR